MQRRERFLRQHPPGVVKAQPVSRVHKRIPQQIRHQPRREILPARGKIIPRRRGREPGINIVQQLPDGRLQRAAVADLQKALADAAEQIPAGDVVFQMRVAEI